jgi:hypothetical protein
LEESVDLRKYLEHIVNDANPQATEEAAFGCSRDLIALARAWLCGFATTNMSIAAMSVRWLCRKLRQVGEGTLGRHVSPNRGLADLDAEFEQLS